MFNIKLNLSGERFKVVYRIAGSKAHAYTTARDICVEQTIEFPADLITEGDIHAHIVGRIESFQSHEPERWEAVISFAVETSAFELTQLLNVVFGNFSLKPGVRVNAFELPLSLTKRFKGPRFGISGIRKLLNVSERPLICAIIKPMGLSAVELAQLAHRFARCGVDMVKDDHGLTDQPFAPFKERVQRCAEAVERANRETGGKCLYIPNVSAPADRVGERALFAAKNGAGGLLVAPGLVGLDTMRCLADDDSIALPIISHPAFQGSYIVNPDSGISPYTLFGQLPRLSGADATIFANYGGRFSFDRADCTSIVRGAVVDMHHIKPIFTIPGGGVTIQRFPEMCQTYGRNVIFLIGGALHQVGPDLTENCRCFMEALHSL